MHWTRRYVSIVLILFLTGCATSIDLLKTKTVPQNESIVFGRIKVISKAKEVNWTTFPVQTFNISILKDSSSEGVMYLLKIDGTFYWHLRPGDYSIAEFEWRRRSSGFLSSGIESLRGRIFATFKVPEAGSLIYIGTLTMFFEDKGYRYLMRVEDEFDQVPNIFSGKFPNIKGEAVKNLMQVEKEP